MRIFSSLFVVLLLLSCTEKSDWFRYFPDTGTYSSPVIADLNGDGTGDIIIGAGAKEDQHADTAVIALDGKTGQLLWTIFGRNQYVGSAVVLDITGDGIPDVFIGGRWAEFSAINGANGKVIWSFFPDRTNPDPSYAGWYNFTTAAIIADCDGDGLSDLLVTNGGDSKAEPADTIRPPGKILILSSASGKILSSVTVPDNREIYMPPICIFDSVSNKNMVYFGTGGETIGGHLYRTTLEAIRSGSIDSAVVLAEAAHKGFVAPPVLADINSDAVPDIIINSAEGKLLAIDGRSDSLCWSVELSGTEAYTIPAVGYFNEDSIPDFFCNFAIGVFPKLQQTVRFMVDGRNGNILFRDTIPAFQYASATAIDLNADGTDEVLLYQSALKRRQFDEHYYSFPQVIDFKSGRVYSMGDSIPATNLASTPWIGDLDGDGSMEMIYAAVKYHDVEFNLARPLGLLIGLQSLNVRPEQPLRWGGYKGSAGNGYFRPRR